MVGPVTKQLYALDSQAGKVWVRDKVTHTWSVCFEPPGGRH